MVWDIATDDFRGACGRGANPLLSVIAKVLTGSSPGSSARPPTARSVAVVGEMADWNNLRMHSYSETYSCLKFQA